MVPSAPVYSREPIEQKFERPGCLINQKFRLSHAPAHQKHWRKLTFLSLSRFLHSLTLLLSPSQARESNNQIYADYGRPIRQPRIRGNAQITRPSLERSGPMKYSAPIPKDSRNIRGHSFIWSRWLIRAKFRVANGQDDVSKPTLPPPPLVPSQPSCGLVDILLRGELLAPPRPGIYGYSGENKSTGLERVPSIGDEAFSSFRSIARTKSHREIITRGISGQVWHTRGDQTSD